MVGKTSIIGRLAVSNLIDTLTDNDFFNIIYVSKKIYKHYIVFYLTIRLLAFDFCAVMADAGDV